jgi:hypothetical protein
MIMPNDFTRGYEPQNVEPETASGTGEAVLIRTGWTQGRYRITRKQHPGGWNYNYTIDNLKSKDSISFQAHHGYLQPYHSEADIFLKWHYQQVLINRARRPVA